MPLTTGLAGQEVRIAPDGPEVDRSSMRPADRSGGEGLTKALRKGVTAICVSSNKICGRYVTLRTLMGRRGGVVCYCPPGYQTAVLGIEGEREGNCFFAGEHTADQGGFLNSGVQTGMRAASEVIASLR